MRRSLRVDAVLGEDHRPLPSLAKQRRQEPRKAGGDHVDALGSGDVRGDVRQHEERRVHRAHRPEVFEERLSAGVQLVLVADAFPSALAEEEVVAVALWVVEQELDGLAELLRETLSGAQRFVHARGHVVEVVVTAPRDDAISARHLAQEVLLKVEHVRGQRVLHLLVALGRCADEDEAERHVRQPADDLMDPTGHAPLTNGYVPSSTRVTSAPLPGASVGPP